MPTQARHLVLTSLLLAIPGLALAHSGTDAGMHHGNSFLAGFAHPFSGLDHLLMLLAVGLWSALTARRIWLAPAAFAGMLAVGALLGLTMLALPGLELIIAASVLVIGVLVAARVELRAWLGASLVGAFAIFHGYAHGAELAGALNVAAALAGMLLGTLILHLIGVGLGLRLKAGQAAWSTALGGGVAAAGLGLLLAL